MKLIFRIVIIFALIYFFVFILLYGRVKLAEMIAYKRPLVRCYLENQKTQNNIEYCNQIFLGDYASEKDIKISLSKFGFKYNSSFDIDDNILNYYSNRSEKNGRQLSYELEIKDKYWGKISILDKYGIVYPYRTVFNIRISENNIITYSKLKLYYFPNWK